MPADGARPLQGQEPLGPLCRDGVVCSQRYSLEKRPTHSLVQLKPAARCSAKQTSRAVLRCAGLRGRGVNATCPTSGRLRETAKASAEGSVSQQQQHGTWTDGCSARCRRRNRACTSHQGHDSCTYVPAASHRQSAPTSPAPLKIWPHNSAWLRVHMQGVGCAPADVLVPRTRAVAAAVGTCRHRRSQTTAADWQLWRCRC